MYTYISPRIRILFIECKASYGPSRHSLACPPYLLHLEQRREAGVGPNTSGTRWNNAERRKRKKPGSKRCGPIKRGPGEDTREPRYRDRLKNRRRHEALVSRGFYREPVHRVCSYANSFGGGSESGGAASGGSRDEQARAGNYPIFAWFARHRRRVRTRREVFGDDWRKLKRGEKWNNFWKDCTNFFLFFFFFKGINTRSFLF